MKRRFGFVTVIGAYVGCTMGPHAGTMAQIRDLYDFLNGSPLLESGVAARHEILRAELARQCPWLGSDPADELAMLRMIRAEKFNDEAERVKLFSRWYVAKSPQPTSTEVEIEAMR